MKNPIIVLLILIVTTFNVVSLASAAKSKVVDAAVVQDSEKRVELKRHNGIDLLHVSQAAAAWNWSIKIIGEGDNRLVAVCRDAICIPLPLKDTVHIEMKAGIFIDAKKLGCVMGFKLTRNDNRVLLEPVDENAKTGNPDSSVYHDAWGKDRGFGKGQTLPDIPLVNMEGQEVRFGKFLGKQYVIYGWASW